MLRRLYPTFSPGCRQCLTSLGVIEIKHIRTLTKDVPPVLFPSRRHLHSGDRPRSARGTTSISSVSHGNRLPSLQRSVDTDINFNSSDYLGLARNPDLDELEGFFIKKYGHRSAPLSGLPNSMVRKFEEQAAAWLGAADSLLVQSNVLTNVCLLNCLLSITESPVYIDQHAQGLFTLGLPLIGTQSQYFNHNDMDDLLRLISKHGPGIVCTETVSSRLGTVAPLDNIIDICLTNKCILIAIESHAVGTIGDEGAGLVHKLGLEKYVPFRTMSLENAFGGSGGLIAFGESVVDEKILVERHSNFLIQRPCDSTAVRHMAALDYIRHASNSREQLERKATRLRKGCTQRGYQGPYLEAYTTPIVPIFIRNFESAKHIQEFFMKEKVHPSLHVDPNTPGSYAEKSVVRFILNTTTTYSDIVSVHNLLNDLRNDLKSWEWSQL